ncbi:MAG TPA: hypothetical protein VHZ52_14520 [Acidobacteriaceae bacterium]|nr:hypothetical protein [Acidobacteriaceae bacterium]
MAVFAKETAVVAAVLAFTYEVLFLARKPFLRRLAVYAPLAVPLAAHLYIRPTMQSVDSRSVIQALSTIPYVCWLALRKLVWPVPVSEFYDLWIRQTHSFNSLAWHICILLCIVCAALWCSLKSRFVAWALAVVALPLAAVLAGCFFFRDYDLFHDRYLYLSAAGIAILIAALIARIDKHRMDKHLQPRLIVAAVAVLVLCVEITQSVSASQQFRDDLSLYSRATQVAPQNIIALQLLAETAIGKADCPTAIDAYQRAQQLRPDVWKTPFFLGIGYLRCGRYAPAAEAFSQAAAVPGATAEQAALAWYELGRLDLVQSNTADALIALRKAASLDPASHKIKMLLAELLSKQQDHS